ncbi:MAG TPA: sulfotransferase, partial [Chloroflexota bacterium]|nr:sulfotransferase [Chloroflexota bacterium]
QDRSQMDASPSGVKVLYIAGCWRSGSTLIGRVLGQASGLISVCELATIWQLGVARNELCSCGHGVRDCGFWRDVFQRAFGGIDAADVSAALHDPQPPYGTRDALATTFGWDEAWADRGDAPAQHRRQRQRRTLGKLYHAIAAVSGRRCIVDGSKIPSYGVGLSTLAGVDLYVLHLVRDSRAVTNSWARKRDRNRDEGVADSRRVRLLDVAREGIAWTRWNLMIESLLRPRASYLRMRYEDFAARPQEAVDRVGRFIGEDMSGIRLRGGNVVHLADEHAADGNRMRFTRGDLAIRLDDRWQQELGPSLRRVVTATTWPLLARYGYLQTGPSAVATPAVSPASP